jgi:hypothetical protein
MKRYEVETFDMFSRGEWIKVKIVPVESKKCYKFTTRIGEEISVMEQTMVPVNDRSELRAAEFVTTEDKLRIWLNGDEDDSMNLAQIKSVEEFTSRYANCFQLIPENGNLDFTIVTKVRNLKDEENEGMKKLNPVRGIYIRL